MKHQNIEELELPIEEESDNQDKILLLEKKYHSMFHQTPEKYEKNMNNMDKLSSFHFRRIQYDETVKIALEEEKNEDINLFSFDLLDPLDRKKIELEVKNSMENELCYSGFLFMRIRKSKDNNINHSKDLSNSFKENSFPEYEFLWIRRFFYLSSKYFLIGENESTFNYIIPNSNIKTVNLVKLDNSPNTNTMEILITSIRMIHLFIYSIDSIERDYWIGGFQLMMHFNVKNTIEEIVKFKDEGNEVKGTITNMIEKNNTNMLSRIEKMNLSKLSQENNDQQFDEIESPFILKNALIDSKENLNDSKDEDLIENHSSDILSPITKINDEFNVTSPVLIEKNIASLEIIEESLNSKSDYNQDIHFSIQDIQDETLNGIESSKILDNQSNNHNSSNSSNSSKVINFKPKPIIVPDKELSNVNNELKNVYRSSLSEDHQKSSLDTPESWNSNSFSIKEIETPTSTSSADVIQRQESMKRWYNTKKNIKDNLMKQSLNNNDFSEIDTTPQNILLDDDDEESKWWKKYTTEINPDLDIINGLSSTQISIHMNSLRDFALQFEALNDFNIIENESSQFDSINSLLVPDNMIQSLNESNSSLNHKFQLNNSHHSKQNYHSGSENDENWKGIYKGNIFQSLQDHVDIMEISLKGDTSIEMGDAPEIDNAKTPNTMNLSSIRSETDNSSKSLLNSVDKENSSMISTPKPFSKMLHLSNLSDDGYHKLNKKDDPLNESWKTYGLESPQTPNPWNDSRLDWNSEPKTKKRTPCCVFL